jgi:phage-related tail protein
LKQLLKMNLDFQIGKDELDKKKKFFEDQKNINSKLERDITALDQNISEMSARLTREETNRIQFQDELGGLKRTVERTSHDLEKARSELSQLKKNINEKIQLYLYSFGCGIQ